MEVVIVERKTFELLVESVKALNRKVDRLVERSEDRSLKEWLDTEDVCRLLKLTPRTLQAMRDSRAIVCSQVGRKFYYKPEDVERVLRERQGKAAHGEF